MSYFLKENEPIFEFNQDEIRDEILSNILENPLYKIFFPIEHHGIPGIDLMLVRNKQVKIHTAKGFLGYESITPKGVQEILLISIQPKQNRKSLEIIFPHQKVFYVQSWKDFEAKFIRYLNEESDEV